MAAAHAAERLEAAHSEVRRACDLLIAPSPESWNICQEALERAVCELSELRGRPQSVPAGSDVRSLALRLRADVRRAAHLLRSLGQFYGGWERILGAMSAGYTAWGDPAPVERQGRICCRG